MIKKSSLKTSDKLDKWRKDQAKTYRRYIKTSAVGLEVGLAIIIGSLLGYIGDSYFNTSPIGVIIGLLIGSMAAIKCLLIFTKSYLKNNDHYDE